MTQSSEVKQLRKSLQNLLNVYIELVKSGDAGWWDPEKDQVVVGAREALAQTGNGTQLIDRFVWKENTAWHIQIYARNKTNDFLVTATEGRFEKSLMRCDYFSFGESRDVALKRLTEDLLTA